MTDIVLHHTDTLDDDGPLRLLRSAKAVRLHAIEPEAYLLQTGQAIGLNTQLKELYRALEAVVMRADLLRAAILYTEGGIYLDLDTVTVASLLPLLDTQMFVGSELIVWPDYVRRSHSPLLWARHLALDVIRKMCRSIPHGWQAFRLLQNLYVRQANNAVMGAEASSTFLADYLGQMAALPAGQIASRTALGPTALQEVVERHTALNIKLHAPGVFSPLPPEISEHWFRLVQRPKVQDVLLPQTRVVHWYASVRTKSLVARIDPVYLVENRHRQLYSALAYSCIGNSAAFSGCVKDHAQ